MSISVASSGVFLHCAFKVGFWDGDSAPTQFFDPCNFTKLEIASQTQESDPLISNIEGSVGETLASVQKSTKPASLSAEANYMPPVMFGLLLGADITEFSQATAGVTDEAITPALVCLLISWLIGVFRVGILVNSVM